MRSKRNSYSGRRRAESAGTIKRRKERATQKAKQPDEVVEVAHEDANNTPESPIRETEERGCIWWLVSSCLVLPCMVLTAWVVCLFLSISDDLQFPLWQDWRFIVPFVVFSIQAFLGLRDGRYRFWLAFPFIVLTTLSVYAFWISLTDQSYIIHQPDFWRDWRFIVLFVLFNSQAFLGLKEGWDSCLTKMFRTCLGFLILVLPAFLIYYLFLLIIFGDSLEVQGDQHFTIFLIFFYYLTFLGIFGFLGRWITYLEKKIKRTIRKGSNK